MALSLWATQALSAFRFPAPVPLDLNVTSIGACCSTHSHSAPAPALLFGLAPAWAAARPILVNALKGEDVLARPGRRWTLRNVLVVSQVAMSLVLLCATGLFLRSLESASGMDIGFRSHGILTMSVDPRVHGYTAARTTQFLTELRRRVAALPGVVSAACTDGMPSSGGHRSDGLAVEGRPTRRSDPDCGTLHGQPRDTSKPWAFRASPDAISATRVPPDR